MEKHAQSQSYRFVLKFTGDAFLCFSIRIIMLTWEVAHIHTHTLVGQGLWLLVCTTRIAAFKQLFFSQTKLS